MNYEIIKNEALLLDFIEWLPELKEHETYYLSLFARSKYNTSNDVKIKSDKAQLKRFVCTKKFMFQKIKQLECELGSYQIDGFPVPQETLALYITPNPRDSIKVAKNGLKKLADLITGDYKGYNVHQEIMNLYQTSPSKTTFTDFDFDNTKEILNDAIIELTSGDYINSEAVNILMTRGGFHLLVEHKMIFEEFNKSWYNNIHKLQLKYSTDKHNYGDNMVPIPGTSQGLFIPYLL